MIVLKELNVPIGTVDLYEFDPMNLRAGVGILLDENYRQKGYGSQVLDLIKDYTFKFLFLKQLYAYVPKKNLVSQKLFTRCGYVQTGILQEWVKAQDSFEDVFFMQLINPKLKI
jgi:diamine N-acetyltransferase